MEGMAACTRCSLRLILGYGSSRRSATPTLSARAQAETNAGEAGARPCSTARTRLTETAARRASSCCVQPANFRASATRLPTPVTSSSLTVEPPLSVTLPDASHSVGPPAVARSLLLPCHFGLLIVANISYQSLYVHDRWGGDGYAGRRQALCGQRIQVVTPPTMWPSAEQLSSLGCCQPL